MKESRWPISREAPYVIVLLLFIVLISFVVYLVLYLVERLGAEGPAGVRTKRAADGTQGGYGSGRP